MRNAGHVAERTGDAGARYRARATPRAILSRSATLERDVARSRAAAWDGSGRVARTARSGICRPGARARGRRARRSRFCASPSPMTTPAHPTSARACPAFAGNAPLDGQRGGGDSSDALDAYRQMPRCAWHEARRAASEDTADGRGNALEREAAAVGLAEARATRRERERRGHVARRRGARVATTAGGGAGDDDREPAFAEATTTSYRRPGPLRWALANPNLGRWSQIESDFLPALTSLHVDWAIVSCIAQAVEFTPVNKVTLFVHKYDADDANDEEYDEAIFCLSHTHWREVVFVEDPFWKLPETAVGRAQRRGLLVSKLGLQTLSTRGESRRARKEMKSDLSLGTCKSIVVNAGKNIDVESAESTRDKAHNVSQCFPGTKGGSHACPSAKTRSRNAGNCTPIVDGLTANDAQKASSSVRSVGATGDSTTLSSCESAMTKRSQKGGERRCRCDGNTRKEQRHRLTRKRSCGPQEHCEGTPVALAND
ncbi:hypothetical protein EV121DRAFT_269594 [Schizophyllum commune]